MAKMAKVIAITNQKGGIGKTTTAVNLCAALNKQGYKTLLIDADGQCNSTDTCRAQVEGVSTLYDLLFEKGDPIECIQKASFTDIIASDPLLIDADKRFPSDASKSFQLKESCQQVLPLYDYIIIDTPPNLGGMLINALTFADEVIVPVTCDRYGMQGIDELYKTISATKKYANPGLKVAGILFIKYHANTVLSREITDALPNIMNTLGTIVFNTKIRESEACKKSQSARMSVIEFDKYSTTARDYVALGDEYLKRSEE